MDYHFIADLADPASIPADGILSRTVYDDVQVKAVLFGFSQGEMLSEYTASMPAILHIVRGDARLTLAGDTKDAPAGAWVHMPANMPHSIYATTPLVMLLILLKT